MNIHIIDILVIALYFVSMLLLGLYAGRKNKSTDAYFLADRSFPGWAVGISMIGSVISSVTFLAGPADTFKTAWFRFVPNFAFPIIGIIAACIFIPFFRRGTITSAYQYLDKRFGASVSGYVAVIFLLTQIFRTSSVVYLLAILMQSILGLDFHVCVLLTAGITAIYTTKGGLKAVIWTDVIQTVILMVGALACIAIVIYAVPGGLGTIFEKGIEMHKFSLWDINTPNGQLEPTPWVGLFSEKTILMVFVAGFFQYLNVQLDQSTVQRWGSARSAREAKQSAYILGFGALPIWATFSFLGTCLFVYFLFNDNPVATAILEGTRKAEDIMPLFITNCLPKGIVGLVIAGALAAGMSTLSACLNAASMVWVHDLYGRFIRKNCSDAHYLRAGKLMALLLSLLMILGASLIHIADALTLADLILSATAILIAGVPGVFLAGMLTRRATIRGVWVGIAASLLFVVWLTLSNMGIIPESWRLGIIPYYTAVFGNIITFIVVYLVSLLEKRKQRDLTNLTIWDQKKTPLV